MSCVSGEPIDYAQCPIGSFLQLLPFHSCAAAHPYASLFVVEGEVADLSPQSPITHEYARCRDW